MVFSNNHGVFKSMLVESTINIHNLKFESANGIVGFQLQKMLGFCGAAIIGNVYFSYKEGKKIDLFEDFDEHVKTCTTPFDFKRCKILMSDKVGGMVDQFCIYNGWIAGTAKYNRKTKHKVRIFECDRKNEYVSNF